MSEPIGVGIIGYGNWGPRIARNLAELDDAAVRGICDLSSEMRASAARRFPSARVTERADEILGDAAVHAVYIATPVGTHAPLVLAALESGKDVLVEKPLASSVSAARSCVDRAAELGRILMVGHTFVYSPPVRKIRDIVARGDLGRILYIDSSRVNLGLFQRDVSVIWDLAPHDLSIATFVSGRKPVGVAAQGKSFFGANGLEDVASMTVEFDDGMAAYLHLSWLSPVKLRRTTVVGDRKMIVYDDVEPVEKIKIYDRGVERLKVEPDFGEFQLAYRDGDVVSPVLGNKEPLSIEVQEFLSSVRTRRRPQSDGAFGLEIVCMLQAASLSLRDRGRFVPLDAERRS